MKFGAEWGVGVGLTGQCYAIPTMQGGVETIAPYVDDFIAFAAEHPDALDLVLWVLFDDRTLNAYERALKG